MQSLYQQYQGRKMLLLVSCLGCWLMTHKVYVAVEENKTCDQFSLKLLGGKRLVRTAFDQVPSNSWAVLRVTEERPPVPVAKCVSNTGNHNLLLGAQIYLK